jgi:Domain of unknown function (DUF4287)
MPGPQAPTLTLLRIIQAKTGHRIVDLHARLAASGLPKVGEKRNWLMEHFKLGCGDAKAVALLVDR